MIAISSIWRASIKCEYFDPARNQWQKRVPSQVRSS
jgi:hypothetical protein